MGTLDLVGSSSGRVDAFLTELHASAGDALSASAQARLLQLACDLLDPLPPATVPATREVSVLIVDLRDFSTFAADRPAEELLAVLTPFLTRMTEVVHAHGGFVDKFLGDGLLALFGAPQAAEDHLARAIACAVDMQVAMVALNAAQTASRLPAIHAGIGINSGEAVVGSFGPPAHREYTAIGDTVNFAARVEAFSLRGQVLLSEHSFRAAGDLVEPGHVRELRVKGRERPVRLFEVAAITRPTRRAVPRIESRRSPRVAVDLPLHYYPVLDARVVAEAQQGHILNLGYDGMLTRLPVADPLPGEICFTVTPDLASNEHSELVARRLHQRSAGAAGNAAFAFINTGTPGHEAVCRYVDRMLWRR